MKTQRLFSGRRICIDVDDTLFDYNRALREWHNQTYRTSLKPEDFVSYFFNEVWGGTLEEAIRRVDEFQHSEYMGSISPIGGAVSAVDVLSQRGKELFIVTARPDYLRRETEKLLDKHFIGRFREIIFSSNHYSKRANSGKTKARVCRELNAFLVDDSLQYYLQCFDEGVGAILFGNNAWNQSNGHVKIIRGENWRRTLELIGVKQ
nr:hypothetical protein [uncultured archaeon]